MKHLRHFQHAFLALALLAMAGCSYFGVPKPETLKERLVYAHSTVNAVVATTTNALNAGALHSSDGEQVRKLAGEARTVLQAAEVALGAGDIETAEGRLNLARGILAQLQSYLASKGIR